MRLLKTLAIILVLAGTATAATYTVRKGDTLTDVSRKFGVPVKVLASANGIGDVNLVRDGQVIRIPAKGATVNAPASPQLVMTGARTHVVRRGENLAGIARRSNTTVSELTKINGLRNPNRIMVGTALRLPGGGWVCPVRGHRTAVGNWGAPRPGYRRHAGNDIFAKRGAPVVAPVSGTVRHAQGKVAGLAFYLDGDDGVEYYGAHLDGYGRGPGRVAAGELIGSVGMTGNAAGTGPHLHFEIHPANRAIDPWPTLKRWC